VIVALHTLIPFAFRAKASKEALASFDVGTSISQFALQMDVVAYKHFNVIANWLSYHKLSKCCCGLPLSTGTDSDVSRLFASEVVRSATPTAKDMTSSGAHRNDTIDRVIARVDPVETC